MISMEDNLTRSVKTEHAFILWPSNHNSKNFSFIYYFTHVKWHTYKVIYCNTVIAKSILKIWVAGNRGLVKWIMVQLHNSLSETLGFDVVCMSKCFEIQKVNTVWVQCGYILRNTLEGFKATLSNQIN